MSSYSDGDYSLLCT